MEVNVRQYDTGEAVTRATMNIAFVQLGLDAFALTSV